MHIYNPYFRPVRVGVSLDDNRPLDKYQPRIPSRKCYPNLGRQLTQDDVGKKILRVHPHESDKGCIDWSFMPINSTVKNAHHTAMTLLSLNKDSMTVRDNFIKFEFKIKWMDRHWLTLDEWLAYPNKDSGETRAQTSPETSSKETALKSDSFVRSLNDWFSRPCKDSIDNSGSIPKACKPTESEQETLLRAILSDISGKLAKDKETKTSSKQENSINERWFRQVKDYLPANYAPADYSWHCPEPMNTTPDVHEERPFDLKSQDPRAILGLASNVREAAQIKKQYHKLALLFHPDKNPHSKVSEEEFKKITAAYKTLLKEVEGSSFSSSQSSEGDDDYALADYTYTHLLNEMEKNKNLSEGELLKRWLNLAEETEKSCKKHFDHPMIQLLLERILLKANSHVHLLQIKSRLDDIKFPEKSECMHELANDLIGKMIQIKDFFKEFDLTNMSDTWARENFTDCFKKANYLVMDKYIAFARCAAEIYVKLDLSVAAMKLWEEMRLFLIHKGNHLAIGEINADMNYMKFLSKLRSFDAQENKFKNPESSPPAQEPKKEQPVPEQKAPAAEQPKVQKEAKESLGMELDTLPEPDEQEALMKNLEKNKEFFRVLPQFKKKGEYIYV